jgi:hypothetical protein
MTDIKQSLRNFVATANSGKYATEEEVLSKFPEFNGYDRQLLRNFVATANSGKYATEDEVFAKFPEFFGDVKKKDQSQNGYGQTQPGSGSKPSQGPGFKNFSQFQEQQGFSLDRPAEPKIEKVPVKVKEKWEDRSLGATKRLQEWYKANPTPRFPTEKDLAPKELRDEAELEQSGSRLYDTSQLSPVEKKKYDVVQQAKEDIDLRVSASRIVPKGEVQSFIDYYNENKDKLSSYDYDEALKTLSDFKKELITKYGENFQVTDLTPEDADLYDQLSSSIISIEDQITQDYINSLKKSGINKEEVEKYEEIMNRRASDPDLQYEVFSDGNGVLRRRPKGTDESIGYNGRVAIKKDFDFAEEERFLRSFEDKAIERRTNAKLVKLGNAKMDKPWNSFFNDVEPKYNEIGKIYDQIDKLGKDFSNKAISQEEASNQFKQLQDQLSNINNDIATTRESYNISDTDLNSYYNLMNVYGEESALKESNTRKRTYLEELDYQSKLAAEKRYDELSKGFTESSLLIAAGNMTGKYINQLALESMKAVKPLAETFNLGLDSYDWTDKIYDKASALSKATHNATGFEKPDDEMASKYVSDVPDFIGSEDSNLPMSSIVMMNLSEGLGSAFAFMTPGGAAAKMFRGASLTNKIARQMLSKGGMFFQLEAMNYERNLKAGMTADDAAELSILQTLQDVAAESVFNELGMLNKARPAGFISALSAGLSKREAFKAGVNWIVDTGKSVAKSSAAESFEEGLGQLSQDIGAKEAELLYNNRNFEDIFQAKAYANSMIAGGLTGGFLDGVRSLKPMSPSTMEALTYAGMNAREILQQVAILQNEGRIDQKKYKQIEESLNRLQSITQSSTNTPGFTELSQADQNAFVATLFQLEQLEENTKNLGIETEKSKKMKNILRQRATNIIEGKRTTDEGNPLFRTYMDANLQEMGVAVVDIQDDGGFRLYPVPGIDESQKDEIVKKATEYLKNKIQNDAIVAAKFQPKTKENAVQEPGTEEVLPRQQGEVTETGGQLEGVGPSIQGEVAPEEEQGQEVQLQEEVVDITPSELAASVYPVIGEIETAIENNEAVNEDKLVDAENKLYSLLDEIDSRQDLDPDQKQRMSEVIENRITKLQNYDNRTRTETSTTTQAVAARRVEKTQRKNERAAIPVRTVAEEGIDVTYDGRAGRVELRDGQYVFVPKKLGAVQARPVVIGEAAQVNANSTFAGVENPTSGPNAVVANITLPNGATLSVLNDDLSVDIGLEIAKQEVGAAPQALFDVVFDEVVSEQKREVPVQKKEEEQAPVQAEEQVQEAPVAEQQAPAVESGKAPYTGVTKEDRALKEKVKDDFRKRRILDQAQRIAMALGNSTPIFIHETTDDYNSALSERGLDMSKDSSNGKFVYAPDGSVAEIHIDLSKANERTIPHEAVHAVLFKAFGDNQALFQDFKNRLKPLLEKSTVKQLEDFANSPAYVTEGVTAEEFMAELGGMMTAQGNRIPKTTLQKIAKLINEFVDKITKGKLKVFEDTARTSDVVDFFNSMADAFAKGKIITNLTEAEKSLRDNSISSKSQSVSIAKGNETAKKLGLSEKYNNVRKIAEALELRQRKKYGKINKNDFSEEASSKISKWMADEVIFFVELMGDKSGKGWYGELFQKGIDNMAQIFPELATDQNARDLFTMLVAITSDGEKVKSNFRLASIAYDYYRKNKKLPTNLESPRASSINGNMDKLNDLLKEFNTGSQLKDNLLTIKSISNLNKERKVEGLKALNTQWPASFEAPLASSIFGPKLGMFYANLSGQEKYPTLDRWWSRTFNRYRGTLIPQVLRGFDTKNNPIGLDRFKYIAGDPNMSDDQALILINENRNNYKNKKYKNGTELEKAANTLFKQINENINDAPFNKSDREFMYDSFIKAQKSLNKKGYDLSIADIQAILWYYEKFLYKTLGAKGKIDGVSYGDVANFIVEKYKENGNSFGYNINPDEDFENIQEEDEMDDSNVDAKKSSLKSKSQQNLVEKAGMSSKMTEDDQGNYLFYHYSPSKISSIDPRFFGRNIRTGRDERPGLNISMYYTRPDIKDVSGDFGYVVRIPKDKVYPFNKDPLDLYDQAKAEFNKKFPGQAFDPNKQVAFIAKEAAKLGYPMTVAKWANNELRAQTTEKMTGEYYTKPAKGGGIEINPELQQFEVNQKARRKALKAKSQTTERTDAVTIENAPSGTYLNIGLLKNQTEETVSVDDIISQLPEGVEVINQKEVFGTEPTVSLELNRKLSDEEMSNLLIDTDQMAIPQLSDGEGVIHGTKDWGDFNPEFFVLPTGEKLSDIEGVKVKAKSQEAAIPKAKSQESSMVSEINEAMNKTGLAKDNSVKRFIEKYGQNGLVAKQIIDNFDKIQEQLGITKICNI